MSLQSKILTHLRSLPHVWAIKVITANERGCPDILAAMPSGFLGVEVKDLTDNFSGKRKIQYENLCRIVETGNRAVIVALDENIPALTREVGRLTAKRARPTVISVIDLNDFKCMMGVLIEERRL